MGYEPLDAEEIYKGRVFTLRRERVRLPEGKVASLDIVAHPGGVAILPVDDNGQVLMIRQYRHAIRSYLLELPAGTLEKNEDPALCAQRELREETGMAARSLRKLGAVFLAPGYSSEKLHIFLATGLYPASLPGDADEVIVLEPIPLAEALRMAETGEIQDAKSLAAFFLGRLFLPGF